MTVIYIGDGKAKLCDSYDATYTVVGCSHNWKYGEVYKEGEDFRFEQVHTYWSEVRAKTITVPAAIYPIIKLVDLSKATEEVKNILKKIRDKERSQDRAMTKQDLQQIAEEIVLAAREGREITKGYTYPKFQHDTPHNEMVDWVVEKLSVCFFCDRLDILRQKQT